MKKNTKPLILSILLMLLMATALVLIIIGVRLKYEELTREKVKIEKLLKVENSGKVNLIAEYQTYSSEERIVPIAKNELGLVKRDQPKISISINKSLINEINRKLKLKK